MGARVLTPAAWDQPRWLAILERMEYRQADVGLRFWGPPLWLEVTMSGPDSDAWSTAGALGGADQSWDWQSTEACDEAMSLAQAGANDDTLLDAASRYTVENLILNATHEIGEWLRFDAQRPFAAHGRRGEAELEAQQSYDGVQGNGSVSVGVRFVEVALAATTDPTAATTDPTAATEEPAAATTDPTAQTTTDLSEDSVLGAESARDLMAVRVGDLAAAWRFSYLPGKAISYGHRGPVITDSTVTPAIRWESTWSSQTLGLVAASRDEFVEAVQHDVHRMLVLSETRQICDAFYVDDRRPWRLGAAATQTGEAGGSAPTDDRSPLFVTVTYDR